MLHGTSEEYQDILIGPPSIGSTRNSLGTAHSNWDRKDVIRWFTRKSMLFSACYDDLELQL